MTKLYLDSEELSGQKMSPTLYAGPALLLPHLSFSPLGSKSAFFQEEAGSSTSIVYNM